ncbi:hypothetical protein D9M69_552030 [compost metagenome]
MTVEVALAVVEAAQVDPGTFHREVRVEAVADISLVAVVIAQAVFVGFHAGYATADIQASIVGDRAEGAEGEEGGSKLFAESHDLS